MFMEYNVEPDKKMPLILVILLFALGMCLALTPAFVKAVPSWCFQFPAMLVFLVCILLLSRFVLTTYSYQLYDSANTMSEYPKLNVYRIRKAGSNMVYCIPFNNIVSIKRVQKVEKMNMPQENLCASMFPKSIYCLVYVVDTQEAVFLECDERFAQQISKRIELWSEYRQQDPE